MKYSFGLLIFILIFQVSSAQKKEIKPVSLEAEYYYGAIIEHNPDISHLIVDHPTGIVLSYNRKTYGWNEWEARYNYPDWGFTFTYQDMQNPVLGTNYGFYGHFNWYFLKRNLRVGVAQGIAFNTNPYDPLANYENNAYGSRFLSTTFLRANYIKENIYKGLGVHLGLGFIHYSNANVKAPNNSTNTLYFSAGVNYLFDYINEPQKIPLRDWRNPSTKYAERIKYNFAFRTGINEADVNGLGQFPFYVFSFYADKRINYKSKFELGVDFFFSDFLISLIRYRAVAFPGDGLTGDEDYRRIGGFIGHELLFNRVAFVTQLGYYFYWPYEFERQIYNRLGIKRYFYKDSIFASITVKSHWAKAEAVEFSIGVRL